MLIDYTNVRMEPHNLKNSDVKFQHRNSSQFMQHSVPKQPGIIIPDAPFSEMKFYGSSSDSIERLNENYGRLCKLTDAASE